VLGRPDLLTDPRFATAEARSEHRGEMIAVLDEVFATRDLADWIVALKDLATPWTVVQTAAEAAVDPQVVANHYVTDVEGPQGPFPLVPSPAQFDGIVPSLMRAPDHGEHTEEILLELGRTWEQIIELKERDVVL
jgi:crotonobetainyl-CoA:carnitine CoA-transferase CaiB-like acyl-CoA transferase